MSIQTQTQTQPNIGDAVLVLQRSIQNKEGKAHLTAAKEKIEKITAIYFNGQVRVQSGDVWRIKHKPTMNYKFVANETVKV